MPVVWVEGESSEEASQGEQREDETSSSWTTESAEEAQKIVRGVIDLAFREEGGWVLVDYKSDRAGEDAEKAEEILYGRYAAQLAAYAKAWEEVTGESVIERGLLLTHYDRYVVV